MEDKMREEETNISRPPAQIEALARQALWHQLVLLRLAQSKPSTLA